MTETLNKGVCTCSGPRGYRSTETWWQGLTSGQDSDGECEAARTIRERFGLHAAFDYAVGEKLINFVSAASDRPAFASRILFAGLSLDPFIFISILRLEDPRGYNKPSLHEWYLLSLV